MKEYSLSDLSTFVAVIESGSFNKAAERLNTSAASVSRRVAGLEKAVGAVLLNRTTRVIRLTEGGSQFYQDIKTILDALEESEERLHDEGAALKGSLRVAAPMSFGLKSIAPLLPKFLKTYPDLKIDLQLDDKRTDLYEEGIDIALRIGKLTDSALVATRLCDIEFGYFASREYLERNGEPKKIKDLSHHQCLTYSLTDPLQGWGIGGSSVNLSGNLSANNGEVLCEAAIQGLGIIALPRFIVAEAVADKKLRPILTDKTPNPVGLYAIRLSRQFTPAKIKLFIEYLKTELVPAHP